MKKMSQISHINWDITAKCNLHCKHCFIADVYTGMRDLDTDQAKEAIDRLSEDNVRSISFQGREPLMREDLIPLMRYATSKGILCTLCTNGTLLHDVKKAKELLTSGVSAVYFSLDGATEEDNDQMRGEGTFAKVAEAIRIFVKLNLEESRKLDIFVNFTLSKTNIAHCIDMVDVCNQLGVDRLYIGVAAPLGNGLVNKEELITSKREMFCAVENMIQRSLYFKRGTRLYLKGSSPKEIACYNTKYSTDFPMIYPGCAILKGGYFMKPNGDMYPCSSWLSARKFIDHDIFNIQEWNVCQASLHDVIRSSSYARMIQHCYDLASRTSCNACESCGYSEVCRLCPISVLLLGENVVENCQIAKEEMEKVAFDVSDVPSPEKIVPYIKEDLLWQFSNDTLEVWKCTSDYHLTRRFKLNPVGRRIWEMMDENTPSLATIVSALVPKKSRGELSENEVLHDVVEFVNRLRFEGFVDIQRMD